MMVERKSIPPIHHRRFLIGRSTVVRIPVVSLFAGPATTTLESSTCLSLYCEGHTLLNRNNLRLLSLGSGQFRCNKNGAAGIALDQFGWYSHSLWIEIRRLNSLENDFG